MAETVFSHESKVELLRRASQAGYIVVLHVILVPEALAVARVEHRVANGGHFVPDDKIRSRHRRLWSHVAQAAGIADETIVYDNSSATIPYRVVAVYRPGSPVRRPKWPVWVHAELVNR